MANVDPLDVIRILREHLAQETIDKITAQARTQLLEREVAEAKKLVLQAVDQDHEPSSDDIEALMNWVRRA